MKKLSKTEKIKILKAMKLLLCCNQRYADFRSAGLMSDYLCHCFEFHTGYNQSHTMVMLPELWRFRPKNDEMTRYEKLTGKSVAWIYDDCMISPKQSKLQAIDKAIKLIQSK